MTFHAMVVIALILALLLESISAYCVKLDLTARDKYGETGFQMAQLCGETDVVNLIRNKMAQIAF